MKALKLSPSQLRGRKRAVRGKSYLITLMYAASVARQVALPWAGITTPLDFLRKLEPAKQFMYGNATISVRSGFAIRRSKIIDRAI